jgi:UDP-galactopyranose mutase
MRFDYNDNAYDHPYQAIPRDGYTHMVENMLDHPAIKVHLNCEFTRDDWCAYTSDDKVFAFYSGAIDEWFDYSHGYLPYRTLDFETIIDRETRDYQGCSVLNSCDASTPWTRSTEHRHFTPWETSHTGTVVTREFPREWREGDIRYYPVRLAQGEEILKQYQELAAREPRVAFIGRLGTYQYLDMDKTIKASLLRARQFVRDEA